MNAYRIELTAPTASFRHPTLVTSYQPTLPVPPVSTILGILSAVTGKWVELHDYSFGYVFHKRDVFVDLETIYKTEGKLSTKKEMKVEPDIVRREIFFEPRLFIYTKDSFLAKKFRTPYYPLLIGRSSDLAMVKSIAEIKLEQPEGCYLYGTTIPFEPGQKWMAGQLQALPSYFENTFPRKPKDVKPFLFIHEQLKVKQGFFCDFELSNILNLHNSPIGIFFYE